MNHVSRVLLAAAIASIACQGCSRETFSAKYQRIHAEVAKSIPAAKQMEQTFGECDHFITHYGSSNMVNIWNSEAFVGGRYTLSMEARVKVDYLSGACKVLEEPKFYLVEVKNVSGNAASVASIIYGKNFRISAAEWKRIYEKGGDFGAVGIEINPEPVEKFNDAVTAWRKPRIPVHLIEWHKSETE